MNRPCYSSWTWEQQSPGITNNISVDLTNTHHNLFYLFANFRIFNFQTGLNRGQCYHQNSQTTTPRATFQTHCEICMGSLACAKTQDTRTCRNTGTSCNFSLWRSFCLLFKLWLNARQLAQSQLTKCQKISQNFHKRFFQTFKNIKWLFKNVK